ncbi:metal ABC transporter substrate-binding protein [Acetanaerobacterium elongatum]|uniref:Zinc transport system substrate-binding protein n=1 Tax=Acetanaerobacterium elongatum TaxID=258515 RepID=A0A1H0FXU8_9FIRM|nr:metal ABC transporter substrate-binding protein [Acetanaerobacterium elongatum]SDN99465.1 zinc transport system substrate-binding protein [Acetanaerobacterium elongatum]
MRRFLSAISAVIILLSVLSGCTQNSPANGSASVAQGGKQLKVYASFYQMADFAQKIGKDKISVTTLVPAGTEPHDWEPAASDIVGLEKADLFIYNGAGMEGWAEKLLASLKNKGLIVVEASKGIKLLEGEQHDGENKEAHDAHANEASYDPHVWLDPNNAKIMLAAINNALAQADPENKSFYQKNCDETLLQLEQLDKEYRDTLAPLPQKNVVVAHQAFGYLCTEYGLNQMAIEGLSPDSEPDPARMAEIIDFVKKNKVKVIFFEELVSPKVAQAIADATGASTDVLNPLEGLSNEELAAGEDYFSVMRKNLKVLKAALE